MTYFLNTWCGADLYCIWLAVRLSNVFSIQTGLARCPNWFAWVVLSFGWYINTEVMCWTFPWLGWLLPALLSKEYLWEYLNYWWYKAGCRWPANTGNWVEPNTADTLLALLVKHLIESKQTSSSDWSPMACIYRLTPTFNLRFSVASSIYSKLN